MRYADRKQKPCRASAAVVQVLKAGIFQVRQQSNADGAILAQARKMRALRSSTQRGGNAASFSTRHIPSNRNCNVIMLPVSLVPRSGGFQTKREEAA